MENFFKLVKTSDFVHRKGRFMKKTTRFIESILKWRETLWDRSAQSRAGAGSRIGCGGTTSLELKNLLLRRGFVARARE
jgi:hypothetical protein